MLDILCIGDSVIDIFLRIPSPNPKFSLDKKDNQLCINYGDKIIVEKFVIEIGGNATNTAVGISRLGLNVGLCAEIGKDEFSQKIINNLKRENVNIDYLTPDEDKQTSITVALSYAQDRTLFTGHVKRTHNFNLEKLETKYVYLTSLGHVWEKTYENVFEYVKKTGVKLAFNPGALQLEKRDKYVMNIIEQADYLFVNKQEAEEILYGKELGLDIKNSASLVKKLLFGLKSLGAKNVIITDSNNGSYAQNEENKIYHLEIVETEAIEKTGAGDAYTAGFLSAILKNLGIKEAMVWGTVNSSCVIQKIGAQEGLASENKIKEIQKSLTNFYPKEL